MSDEPKSEPTEPTDAEKAENEDVEPHGIEVEDDTEAAVLDVNFGCA